VWCKADRPRAAIREALRRHIPHAREAESTVSRPESLVAALSSLLDDTWNPSFAARIVEPVLGDDGFARFRGRGNDRA